MNTNDFNHILQNPKSITTISTSELEKILETYPYFQSARMLYLKGLQLQNSFKYNAVLKTTASYTTDRNILFDFITTDNFTTVVPVATTVEESLEERLSPEEITSKDKPLEIVEVIIDKPENTLEKSILSSIQEATQNKVEDTIEEESQPVSFASSETHSFQEWLQLAKIQPILRDSKEEKEKALATKYEIIDKFIEANPKITPAKEEVATTVFSPKKEDTSYLMTETLAKIYLEQKKFGKAIQAYEILILKYPEKSSLFADRILEIKELQQNNNK